MKRLKFLVLLPLLFFAIIVNGQFNTASFQQKISSVELKPFSDSQFEGTFLSYHIEGKVKRSKKVKGDKTEQSDTKGEVRTTSDEVPAVETSSPPAIESIEVRKRLEPITESNFQYVEKQFIFMPLNDMIVTSDYGSRYHPIDKVVKQHNGVDLRANQSLVFSVLDGIVMDAGYTEDAGNYIKILHSANFETIYLHLDKIYFTVDQKVNAGDIIALSGNTGKSTAPHLHFAVKENGSFVNPITFLNDLIETNNAISDYENTK